MKTTMKDQSTARPVRWLAAISLSLLALTFHANTAMAADATWNGGGGDGINWSDLNNWTGIPQLANNTYKLNGATSTVNVDTDVSPWVITGRSGDMWNNSILNIPAGGKLGGNQGHHWRMHTGSVINITGGHFGMDLRPHSLGNAGGTINISSGTYEAARITYVKSATVNIIGSAPVKVKVSDFFSWMNNSLPTLGFTLDAGGVTPLTFNTHGNDSVPNGNTYPGLVTINVSGIATYSAANPSTNYPHTIPLVRDTNSDLFHPNAWPHGVLVDGGLGMLNRTNNGVDLIVLAPPPPPTITISSANYDANNDQLTLIWNSVPGATYTIENATQFVGNGAGTSWDNLTTGIPSGGATTTKVIDAPSPGTYYRIRKE